MAKGLFTIRAFSNLLLLLLTISTLSYNVKGVEESAAKDKSKKISFRSIAVPGADPIINISVISDDDIYIFTRSSIIHFDGKKFQSLLELKDKTINYGDCNGKVIVFSEDALIFNTFIKPKLYIARIIKSRNGISIANKSQLNLKFSHTISCVKFISPVKMLAFSILEYSLITLDSPASIKIKKITHNPILDDSSPSSFPDIKTRNKFSFLQDQRSIFYINSSDNSAKLNLIIQLNEKSDSFIKPSDEITLASMHDTSFGCVKINNNLLFTFNKSAHRLYLKQVKKLTAKDGNEIDPAGVVDIAFDNKNNIWCLLNNGSILHSDTFSKDFESIKWDVFMDVGLIGADAFYQNQQDLWVRGKNLVKIIESNSPGNVNPNAEKQKTDNTNYIFKNWALQNLGSIYGSAIVNFNNTEFLYTVDIYGANQLLAPPFFFKDFAKEHGITGSDENLSDINYKSYLKIGVAAGDIDESGSDDIIISRLQGNNTLYLNNGRGYFRDASKEYGLTKDAGRSECSILGDVNNDGCLDYFTTGFMGSNHIYLNQSGAEFKDVTVKSGLTSNGTSICAAFGDVNNDGWLDLYVGNWVNENKLYLNNGDGTFRDFTDSSGTSCGILKKTNSVLLADFNNDGNLDLFVGNRGGNDRLFLNDGKGHFTDITKLCGIDSTLWTYGTAFGDFDNDGWLDIFIAYLGGIKLYKNSGFHNNQLKFIDVTDKYIPSSPYINGYNTSVSTFDVGMDGDLDVFVGQNSGVGNFFDNQLNNNFNTKPNYLEVKVIGSESNRSGIGAKIKLFRVGEGLRPSLVKLIAFREVNAGNGYASCSSKIQHFGLPFQPGDYFIEVYFPASGITKTIKVKPGDFITVQELEGFAQSYFIIKKEILKYVHSFDFIRDSLKFIFFLIIASAVVFVMNKKVKFLFYNKKEQAYLSKERLSVILLFAAIYAAVFIIVMLGEKFLTNPVSYTIGTRNIFTDDVLPYLAGFFFMFIILKSKYDKRLQGVSVTYLLENLFLQLKKFEHGGGMRANINRLSLFIQNFQYSSDGNNRAEVLKELSVVISEFHSEVYPELIKISELIEETGAVFRQNLKPDYGKIDRGDNFKYGGLLFRTSGELNSDLISFSGLLYSDKSLKSLLALRKKILNNIQNLKNIVSNISLEVKNHFQCAVNETLKYVASRFSSNYGQEINIETRFLEKESYVLFSLPELNEVLSMILHNSVEEFGKINTGQKYICIGCERVSDKVIITIEDNGKGISEENLGKIFEPGFSTKGKWRGFGLAYARKCVEKFNGKIRCENSESGGAKLVIELQILI